VTVAPRDEPPPSYLRTVLPPVLFLLVAGIVGPIFLVMSFVVEEPDTGWLLPTGIGITAMDLAIGFLIGRGRYRTRVRLHRLRQVGRPARAEVLSFEATGVRINDQPVILLRMRLHGGDFTPFEVQAREVVPELRIPALHSGELPVLLDPETLEWEIDWDSAKAVAPGSPAPGLLAAPWSGSVVERPTADRLAELDDLLRRDLLSREEYDATRARILGGL
jgi:hypothetical protein